jgi:hypothetical protein
MRSSATKVEFRSLSEVRNGCVLHSAYAWSMNIIQSRGIVITNCNHLSFGPASNRRGKNVSETESEPLCCTRNVVALNLGKSELFLRRVSVTHVVCREGGLV